MTVPQVVSASEWLAARKELLAAEARAVDALAEATARRRNCRPCRWRRTMFSTARAAKRACWTCSKAGVSSSSSTSCSTRPGTRAARTARMRRTAWGDLAHLHACDTTFAAVSRAPIGKIEAFRRRMGWSFPWYSSLGSDFNYDFHVTHDEDVAPVEYDFKTKEELIEAGQEWSIRPGEKGGLSVFLRDGDAVLHTYSDYGAMIGLSCGTDLYLALTPFGRQDAALLHHDRYGAGEA